MFAIDKVDKTTMYLTRGDRIGFEFSIDDYEFKVGDVVLFKVYEKKGMDKKPVIHKQIKVLQSSEKLNITLSSNETKIGDMINKATTYWYEIELNGDTTVIGYDEDGAKLFIVYPEGSDE